MCLCFINMFFFVDFSKLIAHSYQDNDGCVEAESSWPAVAGPEPPGLEVVEPWEH